MVRREDSTYHDSQETTGPTQFPLYSIDINLETCNAKNGR
jgi:hypothetical protein